MSVNCREHHILSQRFCKNFRSAAAIAAYGAFGIISIGVFIGGITLLAINIYLLVG